MDQISNALSWVGISSFSAVILSFLIWIVIFGCRRFIKVSNQVKEKIKKVKIKNVEARNMLIALIIVTIIYVAFMVWVNIDVKELHRVPWMVIGSIVYVIIALITRCYRYNIMMNNFNVQDFCVEDSLSKFNCHLEPEKENRFVTLYSKLYENYIGPSVLPQCIVTDTSFNMKNIQNIDSYRINEKIEEIKRQYQYLKIDIYSVDETICINIKNKHFFYKSAGIKYVSKLIFSAYEASESIIKCYKDMSENNYL